MKRARLPVWGACVGLWPLTLLLAISYNLCSVEHKGSSRGPADVLRMLLPVAAPCPCFLVIPYACIPQLPARSHHVPTRALRPPCPPPRHLAPPLRPPASSRRRRPSRWENEVHNGTTHDAVWWLGQPPTTSTATRGAFQYRFTLVTSHPPPTPLSRAVPLCAPNIHLGGI